MRLAKGRFHAAHDSIRPPPEHRVGLPSEIIPQQADRFDAVRRCKIAKRSQPAQGPGAEQILSMPPDIPLGSHPAEYAAREHSEQYCPTTGHQRTSCRADNAWAKVTPSTYSKSPPTGSPRARRVTLIPFPASSCWT